MIGAGDARKGMVIELDDKLYQVIDFQHVKTKHNALARLKLRDVRSGHTIENTFAATEKLVEANLEPRYVQYLYNEGDLYYVMDQKDYEQFPLSKDQLGDGADYLKEGVVFQVLSYKDGIVSVEMPITVELEIADTEPGFKGDTATAGTKPAKLETGITINVPLFINIGDVIKVDTRSGAYLERAG